MHLIEGQSSSVSLEQRRESRGDLASFASPWADNVWERHETLTPGLRLNIGNEAQDLAHEILPVHGVRRQPQELGQYGYGRRGGWRFPQQVGVGPLHTGLTAACARLAVVLPNDPNMIPGSDFALSA